MIDYHGCASDLNECHGGDSEAVVNRVDDSRRLEHTRHITCTLQTNALHRLQRQPFMKGLQLKPAHFQAQY